MTNIGDMPLDRRLRYAGATEQLYGVRTLTVEDARARGMTELARQAGLSRENLYRSLNGTCHPEFETVWKIARALGFDIKLAARSGVSPPARPAVRHKIHAANGNGKRARKTA